MKKAKLLLSTLFVLLAVTLSAQNRVVSGTVIDQYGDPVPGAAVMVDGTRVGTATDLQGKYTLNVRGGDALRFTFFGMRDVVVTIGDKTVIDVTMEDDTTLQYAIVNQNNVKMAHKKYLG